MIIYTRSNSRLNESLEPDKWGDWGTIDIAAKQQLVFNGNYRNDEWWVCVFFNLTVAHKKSGINPLAVSCESFSVRTSGERA